MRLIKSNLVTMQTEPSLRIDSKYLFFQQATDFYTFEDIFVFKKLNEIREDELDGDFLYSEIGNTDSHGYVCPNVVNLENENYLTNSLVKKISEGDIQKVSVNSILIPKVRPNLGKFIFVDNKYSKIFFTKAFIQIKPKYQDIVFFYLLKNKLNENLLSVSRIGKGYPTVNEKDLRLIKFEKKIIDRFLKNSDLEKQIIKLHEESQKLENKKREKPVNIIIDEVFSKSFNYNYDEFENMESNKIQKNNLEDFSNNFDLRFSAKYHRKAGIFATDELCKNSVKIKKALSTISMTGKGISPKDFEEDTDCYYITMADISALEIDYQNLKTVSEDYEDKNSLKKPKGEKEAYSTKVKKGDILMMRSGEGGIGKVALVTQDINAIFSDFIIRFRFDENRYIPKFCYYYMRSKYFQYLVEIHKKGLGNNTNIFPNITNEFPIPNIAKSEQKKIIAEIQNHIMQQKKIDRKIESIQKEISYIIEKNII